MVDATATAMADDTANCPAPPRGSDLRSRGSDRKSGGATGWTHSPGNAAERPNTEPNFQPGTHTHTHCLCCFKAHTMNNSLSKYRKKQADQVWALTCINSRNPYISALNDYPCEKWWIHRHLPPDCADALSSMGHSCSLFWFSSFSPHFKAQRELFLFKSSVVPPFPLWVLLKYLVVKEPYVFLCS